MKHIELYEKFITEDDYIHQKYNRSGEDLSGLVHCQNCGWSWKLSEGGNDPYVCHKCGHDNSL
jgi:hypothetical protein